jgi:hypothetical protein
MQLLIISDCFGANGSEFNADGKAEYHRKGEIIELDPKKKGEDKTCADLQAAGRIVPVNKANLLQCKRELEKKKITVPKDLIDALAEIEEEDAPAPASAKK